MKDDKMIIVPKVVVTFNTVRIRIPKDKLTATLKQP